MCSMESPAEDRKLLLRKGLYPRRTDSFCNKTKCAQMYLEVPSTATLTFFLNEKNVP